MGRNYYEQRKQKVKGEVYIIRVGDRFKIGATINLYSRMISLQTANPQDIELIHRIKTNDMYLTEKLFQALFERDGKREHGEWFLLSDKDIEYIKSSKYSKSIMESIGTWDNGAKGLQLVGELLAR